MASTGAIVKNVYKSKTSTTNCGYCKKPVKTENLKNHCQNVHKKPRLAEGERSITTLFKSSVREDISDNDFTGEVEVSEDNYDLVIAEEVNEKGKKRRLSVDTVVESDNREEENLELNNNIKHNCGPKLDILADKMDALKLSVDVLKAKIVPDIAKPCEAQPSDERIGQLLLCKTLKDILNSFCELSYMETKCLIICDLCYTEQASGGAVSGQFKYKQDGDKRTFSHLKSHINIFPS